MGMAMQMNDWATPPYRLMTLERSLKDSITLGMKGGWNIGAVYDVIFALGMGSFLQLLPSCRSFGGKICITALDMLQLIDLGPKDIMVHGLICEWGFCS